MSPGQYEKFKSSLATTVGPFVYIYQQSLVQRDLQVFPLTHDNQLVSPTVYRYPFVNDYHQSIFDNQILFVPS